MKNLIKGIISYTALVGVPVVCGGIIGMVGYAMGHEEGMQEGLDLASEKIKKVAYKIQAETKEE